MSQAEISKELEQLYKSDNRFKLFIDFLSQRKRATTISDILVLKMNYNKTANKTFSIKEFRDNFEKLESLDIGDIDGRKFIWNFGVPSVVRACLGKGELVRIKEELINISMDDLEKNKKKIQQKAHEIMGLPYIMNKVVSLSNEELEDLYQFITLLRKRDLMKK